MSNPVDQAKTPLLAAIGAGDYALAAIADALQNARSRAEGNVETARERVADFPEEFNTQLSELRSKLDPEELRKVADSYIQAAADIYVSLAERGDEVIAKVRKQPQVDQALDRAEDAAEDARGLRNEVLGTVARQTRSIGEKAARATERVTGRATSAVSEAGADTAHQLRSTSRKAANEAKPAKGATRTKPAAAKKATSARKNAASKAQTAADKTEATATKARNTAAKSDSKAANSAAKGATDTKNTAVNAQNTATAKTSNS